MRDFAIFLLLKNSVYNIESKIFDDDFCDIKPLYNSKKINCL
jgi:hypothetical protein